MDLRALWLAGRFLTRLPFPPPHDVGPPHFGQAVPWYPLIGLLLGLLIELAATGLGVLEPGVAAALVLLLWVWSTGGLHLDGLADSADAWVGGLASRERTLEIMKDPRSGAAGVTAIVLVLIGKWAGLQALILAGPGWLLILPPLLARAQLPILLLTTPYARAVGMGSDQVAHLPRRAAWAGALAAWLGATLIGGWAGLCLVLGALSLFWLGRRAMVRRLGGFTGDTAGAMVEITETALLLVAVILTDRA